MTNINPATLPDKGTTPGNGAAVVSPNSSASTPAPAPAASGNQSDGKVTIDLKEYRDLQRAKARTLSFDKRAALKSGADHGANPDDNGTDPQISEAINRAAQAERRAMQAEVRSEVRDLLERDEFKLIPRSTKELILKNPAMLSSATTKEEAMIDIEDYVRDQVLKMETPNAPAVIAKANEAVQQQNTPAVINNGAPAPASGDGLEDTSKLSGPKRSQATIRNLMKKSKGVV